MYSPVCYHNDSIAASSGAVCVLSAPVGYDKAIMVIAAKYIVFNIYIYIYIYIYMYIIYCNNKNITNTNFLRFDDQFSINKKISECHIIYKISSINVRYSNEKHH